MHEDVLEQKARALYDKGLRELKVTLGTFSDEEARGMTKIEARWETDEGAMCKTFDVSDTVRSLNMEPGDSVLLTAVLKIGWSRNGTDVHLCTALN